MQGKIIKGIAGFYYVVNINDIPRQSLSGNVYECKAKGAFRNKGIKPSVGDNCEFDIVDEEKKLGNIVEILPRTSKLLRPDVANVDQAIIVFALRDPEPNFNLLDRFLVLMEMSHVETVIVFNKQDLVDESEAFELKNIYEAAGYKVLITNALEGDNIEEIKALLKGKTTTFAGPSGVGKSSILNALTGEDTVATGEISEKIKRGKHTTRHSELMALGDDTFIMDTPGFTSLFVEELDASDLKYYYNEFEPFNGKCKFNTCNHLNEPSCLVKEAVEEGNLSRKRYENYKVLYEQLK